MTLDYETRRQLGELDERRDAHKSRLQLLELQAARAGNSAPPEVLTEIADIKTKLVPIDAAIFKLTYIGNVRADVPGNERESNIGFAVERTLERERRAMVARQTDVETVNEVRLTTAMEALQASVTAAQRMALAALVIALVLATYILTKGAT
jgi:hypothetical protein